MPLISYAVGARQLRVLFNYSQRIATQDLEADHADKLEKSFLLPERRTSSLEEELPSGISRAHSRSSPLNVPHTSLSRAHSRQLSFKARGALQVSSDAAPEPPEDQQESKSKRVKGLGLAGIATVFQAVMSVCAKLLGEVLSSPF